MQFFTFAFNVKCTLIEVGERYAYKDAANVHVQSNVP